MLRSEVMLKTHLKPLLPWFAMIIVAIRQFSKKRNRKMKILQRYHTETKATRSKRSTNVQEVPDRHTVLSSASSMKPPTSAHVMETPEDPTPRPVLLRFWNDPTWRHCRPSKDPRSGAYRQCCLGQWWSFVCRRAWKANLTPCSPCANYNCTKTRFQWWPFWYIVWARGSRHRSWSSNGNGSYMVLVLFYICEFYWGRVATPTLSYHRSSVQCTGKS